MGTRIEGSSGSRKRPLGCSFRLLTVLFPALSMVLALPIVEEVIPFQARQGRIELAFLAVGIAFLLGVAAAPGYLYAAFAARAADEWSVFSRRWVRVSLATGFLASAVGLGFTVFAFWFLAVLPLGSLLSAAGLWFAVERSWLRASGRSARG